MCVEWTNVDSDVKTTERTTLWKPGCLYIYSITPNADFAFDKQNKIKRKEDSNQVSEDCCHARYLSTDYDD